MDIDTPPLPGDAALSDFGLRYPLPLRILVLSALTVAAFASNLHLLAHLGIDTAQVLDIRLDRHLLPATRAQGPLPPAPPYVHPTKLYPPLYSLALATLAWAAAAHLAFARLTAAQPDLVVHYRLVPVAAVAAVLAALCWPGNVLCRRERFRFLRALARIVRPSLNAAVPFCDIILADILTSSAKVLGDVWLAGCLVWTGEGVSGVAGDACRRVWGVPFMTSLPYIFRFRQCLSEVYTRSTPTPRRSLLNAAKYATAFPVIIFSAMQTVIGDPFDPDEPEHEAGERILAVLVNSLYSFWWDVTNDWGLSLLTRSGWSSSPAVSYAFIHPPAAAASSTSHRHHHHHHHPQPSIRHPPPPSRTTSSTHTPAHSRARSLAPNLHNGSALLLAPPGQQLPYAADDSQILPSTTFPPPPSRPHSPAVGLKAGLGGGPVAAGPGGIPSAGGSSASGSGSGNSGAGSAVGGAGGGGPRRLGHSRAFSTAAAPNLSYPFLRPILLLPDPAVYYAAIVLDLLLRLTWSLKLSSHLHSSQELESGVFVVELLEVVRRWMWVYLRIEWEAVRKGAGSDDLSPSSFAAAGAAGPSAAGMGGAGGATPGLANGVSWLEKGDGEARLRAHDEYELALRAAAGAGADASQVGRPSSLLAGAGADEAELGLLGTGKGRARDEGLL
ncbi:hypothetical protein Rhopal_004906-T1 [Rhodotorula paludigena]|uniref:EXS domain-containing protein n=1 Tax=Rhodotorula paludigena TaxID=86838 RepID=A0AAV5GH29_9BASI|nr:hypothetical protein Rhopal_004906-T1 [Rhodotorula paludigena]